MDVRLTNPRLEQFITEQVRVGNFDSAEAVLEAALEQMMDSATLSDEDLQAIDEADEQIDRGESIDFDTFAARTRTKYGISD